ncbi:MAG TPA: hypothetical protein VHR39_16515 [Propionibacteriaceae bacterium]|nr:hypothetical protein [Propionibacteriaceae bacterium]
MNKRFARFSISAAAVLVLAAGCSSGTGSPAGMPGPETAPSSVPSASMTHSPSHSPTTTSTAPDATEAAALRATLTSLLSDHVWLAGNALDTAVQRKGDLKDPQVVGAVKALDANSVALAKAVGSVYPDAEKPFLASWRQHIGFFVNYTLGKATKDDKRVAKAKADLDNYRTSFGELINSVVPELPADAVVEELKPHVNSLYAAIDASVAGKPDYQTKLSMAANHMAMTAEILAGGIAKNKGLEGDVDGVAATVRAALTSQLSAHVWLAGNALDTAVQKKGDLKDPKVVRAVKALDANSVALAKTVGSVYPDAEKPFLASWRQHIGFFVNYTLGKATKDDKQVAKAKTDLDNYRTSFGELINSVIPELPADAVAEELSPHVDTLFAAIDASVAGKPDYQTKLTKAANHMPMTAAILTSGIVANKKIDS